MMKATFLSVVALVCFASPCAFANESLQTSAAAVFEKRGPQVLVLTVTRKAGKKDKSFETTAIAVNGSGLLATSLKALESKAEIDSITAAMLGDSDDSGKKKAGELTRVAWLRDDATEVEGELLLKDELLDLAMIRLKASDGVAMPEAPAIAESAPVLLENTLALGRLSGDFQRAPKVGLGQVSALITNPRPFYQISGDSSPGMAVYNLKGEWIGLVAQIEDETVVVPAAAIRNRADSVPAPEKP